MRSEFGRIGRKRVLPLIVAALIGSASCSGSEVVIAPPSRDAMIQGFVDMGLSEVVANCVVGWSDRFELAPLDPTQEREPSEQLLIDEAIENCTTADALVNPTEQDPERLAFDDQPYTYGDDLGLDLLWGQCERGDGQACDTLWERAPVGSEYESFGVTCGQRLDLLNCAQELAEPSED